MLLTRVELENFRGLPRLELDLDAVTVLIGENNVGKTSILEALELGLGRGDRARAMTDYDHHRPDGSADLPDGHQARITLTFAESEPGEWPSDVAQALAEVIQIEDDGRRLVAFRLTSVYHAGERRFETATAFLNREGAELPRRPRADATLRRLSPLFYLGAARGAATDFQSRSRLFSPFLRDPQMPAALRRRLEDQLKTLNDEVIAASAPLEAVRVRLEGASELVALAEQDTARLESVPGRLTELLSRTDVRLTGAGGASLPLDRHGAGTQNVAVLLLFEAYLAAILDQDFDAASTPVLALEEPEAHLHPSAVRALWTKLENLAGQRIVATHSGDLLAKVPLEHVRRLRRTTGGVEVRRLRSGTLDPDEARKVDFHVRRTRGESLFARAWLLGEGPTEFWVFRGAAEVLGIDLERLGIAIVEPYSPAGGADLLAKVADDFGIAWHCVADADPEGQRTATKIRALLGSRSASHHLTVLPWTNMEHLLCEEGFDRVYEPKLTTQQRQHVTHSPGDPAYWPQVCKLVTNLHPKEALALEAVAEMRAGGAVPRTVESILRTMERLSRA